MSALPIFLGANPMNVIGKVEMDSTALEAVGSDPSGWVLVASTNKSGSVTDFNLIPVADEDMHG
jgi:hypothetical protein